MQRLGELNNKVIVEQKTAPENKHVIWKDPVEWKFKEFKDGSWEESEEISIPGGPISPEDITPEILDDETFRKRFRFYGHTIEEIKQMIQNDKCIRCKCGNTNGPSSDEDFSYVFNETPFLLMNNEPFNSIDKDANIEYIYICSGEDNDGLLLKHIGDFDPIQPDEYVDVLNTFSIRFDENGDFAHSNIGYDSF